ncbi:hypothetical protein UFOVP84_163 [uncultured Caudovirales phage]|uniref:Uncharacterized protein n=1 Tax=uncultured Caudovirales phage TaxID=2100421 RepID=A0A6J5L499_9CAUD|nr:hypothetical protein UFOVP84_163 [uncultured Caudovirales phage]
MSKSYYVEINYKKGPSFSCGKVQAETWQEAKVKALDHASRCGFNHAVKKLTVKEEL